VIFHKIRKEGRKEGRKGREGKGMTRSKNIAAIQAIVAHFQPHARGIPKSVRNLVRDWDSDVGFRTVPVDLLNRLLQDLYTMRHNPIYKEIKKQIIVHDRRRQYLERTMVLWASKIPQIDGIEIEEVRVRSHGRKIYESFIVAESFCLRGNSLHEYARSKQMQNQCWYCDESSHCGHATTSEHKETYLAYIQSLSTSLSLPEEVVQQIMSYLYRA
jgi:hypothetical protein